MSQKTNKLKEKLPTYTSPEGLWAKIDSQLNEFDAADVDKNIINKLPTYVAPTVFDIISPKTFSLSLNWIYAAASIVLLLGFGFGFKHLQNKPSTQISYRLDTNTPRILETENMLLTIDTEFSALLNYNCKTQPKVCEMPDYKELQKQLDDIAIEENALKQALEQYNSPELVSHLVRLTNDKIKLEKYILELFS
jgi:hypothetical protein